MKTLSGVAFFILFFQVNSVLGLVVINEFLPHPPGKEPDNEWVELWTNETVFLTDWKIGDITKNYIFSINFTGFGILACNATAFNLSYPSLTVPVVNLGCNGTGWLNNDGDTLSLYNTFGEPLDTYTYSSTEENFSKGRWPDGNGWYDRLIPTPGKANKLVGGIEVKFSINTTQLSVGESLLIEGNITNTFNTSVLINLTIKIRWDTTPNETDGWKDVEVILGKENYQLSPLSVTTFTELNNGENLTWKVSNCSISGKYKVLVSLEYDGKSVPPRSKEFNVTALPNLGEPEFAIINSPTKARFGDFTLVATKFYSGNLGCEGEKLKFIAYVWEPHRVAVDLDGNTIYKEFCDQSTAIEANVNRGQTLYLYLPIFLKRNCENKYPEGEYRGFVRVCRWDGNEWSYTKHKEEFTFQILGRNERLCPQPEMRTVFVERKVEQNLTENFTKEDYKIIYVPDAVRPGEEFNITILIRNSGKSIENFTVYSYVFEGKKLLSEGLDEKGEWRKGWTANKRQLLLQAGEEKQITLTNRVKVGVEPGEYSLRVRIKGGKDLITPIAILKPINATLQCRALDDTILVAVINSGDEANFTLLTVVEKNLTRVKEFWLREGERKEFSFPSLERNNFLLIHKDKILDSCSYVKRPVKIEKTREKGIGGDITGMFVKGVNRIVSLFNRLLKFLGLK